MKNCSLCGRDRHLELSHILPKFIFRYQKKSSPTGVIRATSNPNRIIQDGEKIPFLCGECEDLFSRWETSFANGIFYPYEDGLSTNFTYKEDLSKFLASLSFRCLKLLHHKNELNYVEPKLAKYVPIALENLANYLLGKTPHPKEQRQHLVLLDSVSTPNGYIDGLKESDFNLYSTRAIEYDVVSTDYEVFIYIKFLKFLVLCPIFVLSQRGWRSSRISHKSGILKPQSYELNDYVMHRMISGARKLIESRSRLSDKQLDVIKNNISKQSPETLINSPLGKAVLDSKS